MFLEGGICMNIRAIPNNIDVKTDNHGSSQKATLINLESDYFKCLDRTTKYEEEELEDERLHIVHDHNLYNFTGKGLFVLTHAGGWREYFSKNMTISEADKLANLYEEFLEDRQKAFPGYGSFEMNEIKTNWEILLRTKYRDLRISNIV